MARPEGARRAHFFGSAARVADRTIPLTCLGSQDSIWTGLFGGAPRQTTDFRVQRSLLCFFAT